MAQRPRSPFAAQPRPFRFIPIRKRDAYPGALTLAVSGRRPDGSFQVSLDPHAGGGHEHRVC